MRECGEVLKILREEKADRGNSSRTGDHKICPSIKETKSLAIDFAEVFVESARLWHLSDKLALRERAEERENTREHPDAHEIRRARQIARHLRGRRKNSRPHDRADHEGRRCVKTESAFEIGHISRGA